jgi:hypothetical protein
VERLSRAHARAPQEPEIARELWNILLDISKAAFHDGRPDAAQQALEAALAVGPRNDFVLRHLALAKAIGGQPGGGLGEAREACRLGPQNTANWRVLYQVALSAGETAEAKRAADRAGVQFPSQMEKSP